MTFHLHPKLDQDSLFIADRELCQWRLLQDPDLPWILLVPRKDHLTEIMDLSREDREKLMEEIALAGNILRELFSPEKINIGALGNLVPQLHIHIMARFKGDRAWPQSVWGVPATTPLDRKILEDRKRKIVEKLF